MTAGVVLAPITEVSSQGFVEQRTSWQSGGEECDGETGDLEGRITKGSICKPAIHCAKERWFLPTSGKPPGG